MAAQEVLRRLVEEELQIQRPRPGQGHHEAGELTLGAADHDGAEVRPVDLCLLGRKNLQSQEGFVGLRAQTCHHAPQLLDAAGVAAIPDHLVDARGAQPRMLLQHLAHKRQIRIDDGGPQRLGVLEAFHFNGAPYGVGVDVQGGGNGADFPMLGVEIAANLYAGFGTDHAKLTFVVECVGKDRRSGLAGHRSSSAARDRAAAFPARRAARMAAGPQPAS